MTDTTTVAVEAVSGAVTMEATMAVKASVTAPLQSVVDTADAATAELRTQRDALITQRAALDGQIATLNAQIATAEGPGAQIARNALAAIQAAMVAQPSPAQMGQLGGPAAARMAMMRARAGLG